MDLRIDLKRVGGEIKTTASMASSQNDSLSQKIQAKGLEIFKAMESDSASIFNRDWWNGRIMDWSMQNEAFKTQMFRFVDVLPYLNSSDEVARHLKEYFSSEGQEIPSVLGWGLGLGSLAPGLMASAIRKNVTQMARMFITGETPEEAFKNLEKMRKENLTFTVDILGEAAVSEAEAETYQKKYLDLIETLAVKASRWSENELIDKDHMGPISKVNVSVKVSSLFSQIDPIAPEKSTHVLIERLRPIFRRAKDLGVFINLDMEAFVYKDLTLSLFKTLMNDPEFRDHNNVGIVIQAYLRESERDLLDIIKWAKSRSGRVTIRLVKGAYWDYETILAKQKGWPIPVFTNKKETDANYEKLSLIMLENDRYIKSAFGSHNIRSLAHALTHAERLGVDKRSFEVQMLYGMAEPIKKALVKQGLRVREYAPVGELIPGMAYLVRRLLENTSNESFLRAKFSSQVSPEELLKDPAEFLPQPEKIHSEDIFENEPPIDFNIKSNRDAMEEALQKVKKRFGKTYPLVIGKKEVKTGREHPSLSPSNPEVIVGKTFMAGVAEADLAVQAAHQAQEMWAKVSVNERCILFEKVAEIMKAKKFELAALEVFEVGKTWREADGDIAEAIDFCRYYARQLRKLGRGIQTSFIPGEDSRYIYKARGVGVVIAPWNFPLAILTGMVAASAICGNTVIMKPAEQSSVIAAWFMEILKEAGLPPGVVNFLPGFGEEAGEHLIQHPQVDFVVFTGSKDVGLHIISTASKTLRSQRSIKKVVAELGGKNAIIIDSDADLDEAVVGTLHSAFGFQGQKCSACSRVIVLEENYDKFLNRLLEGARSLEVGPTDDPGVSVGPVVDKEAYDKILSMIEVGKKEGHLAFQSKLGTKPEIQKGYFVPPTIFTDVKPDARIAQEEIFGPVLAVIKAKSFDDALKIANGTAFALTGGVYSRSPAHIDQAKTDFDVGNLYINRGITGAMVGRHPFGGYKMSGVGSKAGGPDYLLQFMEPRTITENTMRRGFAPPTDGESEQS